ncbi:MAG: OsmC family protein [Pseudomonadota bacterium]|nr:OsmC family protein [Pseudomonadota bacterium]
MTQDQSHSYALHVRWTGNRGSGTSAYDAYSRDHVISAPGKPDLHGSSDPAFRGDAACYNPEELLVASLSTCHMLWVLHLCAQAGITLTGYEDAPEGRMSLGADGGGRFTSVTLRPRVSLAAGADRDRLPEIHEEAHRLCFIANSVNFPVNCAPAPA